MCEDFKINGDANLAQEIYDSFSIKPAPYIVERLYSIDAKSDKLNRLLDTSNSDIQDCFEDLTKSFVKRFVYHSTAIEGSALTLPDVELVIEGKSIPRKEIRLRDLYAATCSHEAYEYAMQAIASGRVLDESFVKDVHLLTALDMKPRYRGSYRISEVRIANSLTVPALSGSVRPLMKELCKAFSQSKLHPIIRAAAFHAMFENVHPFLDGNGRCGRILLDSMLVQAGYPPIAITHEDKARYAKSLEDWQVRGNPRSLVEMVVYYAQREIESRLAAVESTMRLIPFAEQERCERCRSHKPNFTNGVFDRIENIVDQRYTPRRVHFTSTPDEIPRGAS